MMMFILTVRRRYRVRVMTVAVLRLESLPRR